MKICLSIMFMKVSVVFFLIYLKFIVQFYHILPRTHTNILQGVIAVKVMRDLLTIALLSLSVNALFIIND